MHVLTVVYLDGVFLLNLCVNYLLLLCTARLGGMLISRWRLAAGALVGAIYAVIVFLPHMEFLLDPLCKIAVGVFMVLLAFGATKHLLRASLLLFAVSFALGGAVYGIGFLSGGGLTLQNGVFYSVADTRLLLLAAALCYAVFSYVLRHMGRQNAQQVLPAVLRIGDKTLGLRALVDTGNHLVDPATNQPVLVVDGTMLSGWLEQDTLTADALARPVEAMARLSEQGGAHRYRLLPYRAVGVDAGLLLAVRLDSAKIGVERYEGAIAALSPTPVSDGGDYQALVGAAHS